MKALLTIALAGFIAPCVFAQTKPAAGHGIEFLPTVRKAPVRKGVTNEEVLAQRSASKFGGFAEEGTAPKGWDLETYSEFIAIDGNFVILPRGSVIYAPEAMQKHILDAPDGKLVTWADFLTKYRSMVSQMEVTMEEVKGEKPIAEERFESAAKNKQIVVAVYNRNPITVLKPSVQTETESR
ncbi:hypothetical protein [Luteolibacter sp. AS25]|uniref:hypothetical protein n=1 Tax=Luteolibacter sp. AS25 TaxID=3135776 RepID=UPI00398BA9D0